MLRKIFVSLVVAAAPLTSAQTAGAAKTPRPVKQTPPAARKNDLSHIRPAHRATLGRWLKRRPSLRPATEADCLDKDNLAFTRKDWGKNYHPYYSVGDFNRDGREDFAVLLIDLTKEDKFAIAIFNAPFARKSAPNYFENGYDHIGSRYIVYDGMVKRRLYLGVYEGDYYCVTFYPRGGKYVFKDCLP